MRFVQEYKLPPNDTATLNMPPGAEILSVQDCDDESYLKLWALVETGPRGVTRHFRVVGDGDSCDGFGWTYIGTVQACKGRVVFHVFEVLGP